MKKEEVSPFEPVIYEVVYKPGEIKATGYMEMEGVWRKSIAYCGSPLSYVQRCNSASIPAKMH